MYGQCLAEVFLDRLQSVSIFGRVAESENAYCAVDQKSAQLDIGGVSFALEQAVYVTSRR
jgi:hypothetical protein